MVNSTNLDIEIEIEKQAVEILSLQTKNNDLSEKLTASQVIINTNISFKFHNLIKIDIFLKVKYESASMEIIKNQSLVQKFIENEKNWEDYSNFYKVRE